MLSTYTRVEIAERMTSADFFRLAPEDEKVELIDGVMHVSSPALDTHERLQGFLYKLLGMFIEAYDLGELRGSRTAVELEDDQTYEPDILFVSRERTDIIHPQGIFGAPDLVVEILSLSTAHYDRQTKFYTYERARVRELWLIDPYGPAGTEFYQRQDRSLKAVMPDAQGILHSVALPGFKLQVSWLWPEEGRFIPVREALRGMEAD